MPAPPSGQLVDPNEVNVRYTPAGSGHPLFIPSIQPPCDPKKGGWYFDNEADPTSIFLCPSTCSAIDVSLVDVQFNCARIFG